MWTCFHMLRLNDPLYLTECDKYQSHRIRNSSSQSLLSVTKIQMAISQQRSELPEIYWCQNNRIFEGFLEFQINWSKLEFWLQDWTKWTKVDQARILVNNWRSSTPAGFHKTILHCFKKGLFLLSKSGKIKHLTRTIFYRRPDLWKKRLKQRWSTTSLSFSS